MVTRATTSVTTSSRRIGSSNLEIFLPNRGRVAMRQGMKDEHEGGTDQLTVSVSLPLTQRYIVSAKSFLLNASIIFWSVDVVKKTVRAFEMTEFLKQYPARAHRL